MEQHRGDVQGGEREENLRVQSWIVVRSEAVAPETYLFSGPCVATSSSTNSPVLAWRRRAASIAITDQPPSGYGRDA